METQEPKFNDTFSKVLLEKDDKSPPADTITPYPHKQRSQPVYSTMSSIVHGPDPLSGMGGPPLEPGKKPVTELFRPEARRSPVPYDPAPPDGPHDSGSDRPVTPDVCWATKLQTF